MKKPVVDYRAFRFSRLNTPQFAHMKPAILGWLFYFSFYFFLLIICGYYSKIAAFFFTFYLSL